MKSHHIEKEERATCFPCDKCNFVFETNDKFKLHLSGMQHNAVQKESDYEDDESDSDDEEYFDKCGYCGIVFNSIEATDDHQSNYLRCEQCETCFHNEFQWDDHENCER